MDEIEENDFNLNISRYISTVEPEAEINLGAVHKKLLTLDERIPILIVLQELDIQTVQPPRRLDVE